MNDEWLRHRSIRTRHSHVDGNVNKLNDEWAFRLLVNSVTRAAFLNCETLLCKINEQFHKIEKSGENGKTSERD